MSMLNNLQDIKLNEIYVMVNLCNVEVRQKLPGHNGKMTNGQVDVLGTAQSYSTWPVITTVVILHSFLEPQKHHFMMII